MYVLYVYVGVNEHRVGVEALSIRMWRPMRTNLNAVHDVMVHDGCSIMVMTVLHFVPTEREIKELDSECMRDLFLSIIDFIHHA